MNRYLNLGKIKKRNTQSCSLLYFSQIILLQLRYLLLRRAKSNVTFPIKEVIEIGCLKGEGWGSLLQRGRLLELGREIESLW